MEKKNNKFYNNVKTPLVLPYSMIKEKNFGLKKTNKIYDYGIKIIGNKFKILKNYCILPNQLVLGYALSFLASANVKKIYLAGFDGYDLFDTRKEESEIIFKQFKKINKNIELISITNTNFNLKKISLHGLGQ